jgi:ankyrin repeat protein
MDAPMEILDALKAKDHARVRALLAADPALANARAPDGASVLRHALYLRASDSVKALLATGARPDVYDAATLGDTTRVRALAKDIAVLGPDGALPLHLAAHFGHVETVRELLRLGAPVAQLSASPLFANTALHAACAGGGQAEVVRVLLAAGAPVDALDKHGYTPLHIAAANGAAACVEALLAKGAKRDARAPDGKTPLDFARERGFVGLFRQLSPA